MSYFVLAELSVSGLDVSLCFTFRRKLKRAGEEMARFVIDY